jgi:hypothetical protein
MEKLSFARHALTFIHGDWLDGTWDRESRRFIPSLVLGVYIGHKAHFPITMKEAARAMNTLDTATCKKYVDLACERGLVMRKPYPDDKRKALLVPTDALIDMVEKELTKFEAAAH